MKTRPILFTAENGQLVHEGKKTQTRRIIKPQPIWVGEPSVPFRTQDADPKGIIECPYGTVGDQLWIKETHAFTTVAGYEKAGQVIYKGAGGKPPMGHRWKPSIHMPRWASRTTLEITEIRAERLQSISEEDAKAEGVTPVEYEGMEHPDYPTMSTSAHRFAYQELWESINGPGSWERNDCVWAITFRKL
jgi:hypothetical protein